MAWSRFQREYRTTLINVGIPEGVVVSEERWGYFIDHFYDDSSPETLNLEAWSDESLSALLVVLDSIHRHGFYAGGDSGVRNWIRQRISAGLQNK